MISIDKEELNKVADYLKTPVETVKEKFIEESEGGTMLVSAIPCHCLGGTKCTVYEARFSVCREFPHLHQPGFTSRLFNVMQHYSICPIVFNVVEALKDELRFSR
jgi:Fe-S-cluster containining protein